MKKELFGTLPTGESVYKYTLEAPTIKASFIDRGATITNLIYGGVDVVGGFDTLEAYLTDTSHQGAIIGRVANRIENARFTMDGRLYTLPKNDGENCLHGGDGFDHRLWSVTEFTDSKIVFTYEAKDKEEGFPAALSVKVSYTLSGSALMIDYEAYPDGKTPVALTNHAYFNLDGFGGTVKEHTARIFAEKYTAVNAALIPSGEHPDVLGTAFDFTEPHAIGERIDGDFIGYDHNFMLAPKKFKIFAGKALGLAAEVRGKRLGMKVYTDQPGVQFYIGNFLGDGPDFKGGIKPVRHGAFCLEAQTEPNCINHGEGFYEKGEIYRQTTVYEFDLNA